MRRGGGAARLAGALAILAAAAMLPAAPARAQLTFPSAGPVSAGNLFIRTEPAVTQGSGGFQSLSDLNVMVYGASRDLAFILENSSLVSNSANVASGGTTQRRTATGFGDTLLYTRYTVLQRDDVGSTFRVAPLIGVNIPTGADNANPSMPRGLQPGTGVWGARPALAATMQTLTWNAAAEVAYQVYGTGGDYHPGNVLHGDAGFHYLLWPADLDGEVHAELYASLEANYTSAAASRMSALGVPGTGGQLLLVDPGLIYTTTQYSLSLSAMLPAYQNVGPDGTRFGWGLALYFNWRFFSPYHF